MVKSPEIVPQPQDGTSRALVEASRPNNVSGADNDLQLVALWIHGRNKHTARAYKHDVRLFLERVNKPLASVTVADMHRFVDSLQVAPRSKRRAINAVRSLLSYAQRTGYIRFNVGTAVELPSAKDTLSERILSEDEIKLMIDREHNGRNHMLLRMLYATGCRVSEICDLHWRDVHPRGDVGQVTVFGKGGKTRSVKLAKLAWVELIAFRGKAGSNDPVFRSQRGGPLSPLGVWHIVRKAAIRAEIKKNVSPHWFRHAHASHALDNGSPSHLVKTTLGHASLDTTGNYAHARPDESSGDYLPE
jgi:integrase/recombinase XerD